jgi:hypothetical protein
MASVDVRNEIDLGRPQTINDDALAWFDDLGRATSIDDKLLSAAEATAVHKAIRQTLKLLQELDLRGLLRKQGLLFRVTGADLEAKLRFELAAKQVTLAFAGLDAAANRARLMVTAMRSERARVVEEVSRLSQAISTAQNLLSEAHAPDDIHVQRLQRRLGNLQAMHVANTLAIEQFKLAEHGLTSLLDRYREITDLLVPLWQQHLFAILHSPRRLRRDMAEVEEFCVVQEALEEYFAGELK